MKNNKRPLTSLLLFLVAFAFIPTANAQLLKKLGKRAEKAAERAVERRVERETTEKTEAAMDSILEPGKKGAGKKAPTSQGETKPDNGNQNGNNTGTGTSSTSANETTSIEIYRKFDFVPGDELLFYDDFKKIFPGDFPSKWNGNGSGEIVMFGEENDKWLSLKSGGTYIPVADALPENYTVEFDLLMNGIDKNTSSNSRFTILFDENNSFQKGRNFAYFSVSPTPWINVGPSVETIENGKRVMLNNINADLREDLVKPSRVSIAVNKRRVRFWLNERKIIDIPQLLPGQGSISTLKIMLKSFRDQDEVFIKNFRIAKADIDLRRKLIEEGKISTNAILFNSGSATLQPQSMGVIRQIFQVLQQENDMKLKIVGHTDSDGEETSNLSLSKKRAEAVKNALVSIYNVSADRLQADGKGESEPVGDNTTPDGKAQNRRVEFIKI